VYHTNGSKSNKIVCLPRSTPSDPRYLVSFLRKSRCALFSKACRICSKLNIARGRVEILSIPHIRAKANRAVFEPKTGGGGRQRPILAGNPLPSSYGPALISAGFVVHLGNG
jgi:hypothetical protein